MFEQLLRLVPDTASARALVLINDYAMVRDFFRIPLPGPDAGVEDLDRYLEALIGLPGEVDVPNLPHGPFISGHNVYGRTVWQNRRVLGFDVRNVHQSVEAGVPPQVLEIVRGRFDPEASARALISCSGCPTPDLERHLGVVYYGWGDDFELDLGMRLAAPAFDALGRGGRLAVQDRVVYRTMETAGMRALIEAGLGERPSLADVESFRLLAVGLARMGAYSVLLSDRTQASGGGDSPFPPEPEGTPVLRPYVALGSGAGVDEQGPYMVLALVHADSGLAEENTVLLRRRIEEARSYIAQQPWARIFDVDRLEVRADGPLLLAKLRKEPLGFLWGQFFYNNDPLILHE